MDGAALKSAGLATTAGAVILLITGDAARQAAVTTLLQGAGHLVRHTSGLSTAQASLAALPPAIVIIDGQVDGLDALGVCSRLQPAIHCPIICIDRSNDVIDRIIALELGADDYLAHPVHDRELLGRVKALLRRSPAKVTAISVESGLEDIQGLWRLDTLSRQVFGPGRRKGVMLTVVEQALLRAFLRKPGRVITGHNAREVWPEGGYERMRTTVSRLRRKLARAGFHEDTIRNLRSAGYVFDEALASQGVITT